MMIFLSGLGLGCSRINVGMEGNVLDYTLEYKLALCMFSPVPFTGILKVDSEAIVQES